MGSTERQRQKAALEALSALVEELSAADPVALRSARLSDLEEERRVWMIQTLAALDDLLDAVDRRAEAIAAGEVAAPTIVETPAVSDADLAAYVEEQIRPEPEAQPEAAHEPESADESEDAVEQPAAEAEVAPPPAAAPPPPPPAKVEEELPVQAAPPPPPPAPPAAVAELDLQPEPEPEPEPVPAEVEAEPGWTRTAELLFEDALRLFRLGDSDGALVSLERLLSSVTLNDDLREFVRVNEPRVLQIYEAVIGSWDGVPHHRPDSSEGSLPAAFFRVPKIATVLELVDGQRTIRGIMELTGLTRLESISAISQLIRAKAVVIVGG